MRYERIEVKDSSQGFSLSPRRTDLPLTKLWGALPGSSLGGGQELRFILLHLRRSLDVWGGGCVSPEVRRESGEAGRGRVYARGSPPHTAGI